MPSRLVSNALVAGLILTGCTAEPKQSNNASDPKPIAISTPPETTAKSGLAYQSLDTQQLQADPFANPGMLAVDAGEHLWITAPDSSTSACASCHLDSTEDQHAMRGIALLYPKVAVATGQLENLEQRINRCRTEQQQQPKLAYESNDLLALTAYIGHQSQGLTITGSIEPEAQPYFEAGKRYFYQRRGQMNLACHHCHELNAGRQLRGDLLSQGQSNGYPAYRLEWQKVGSLQRRLRFCNLGVRAEPHPFGAPEYVNLELYLRWRSTGLPIETPAVRR